MTRPFPRSPRRSLAPSLALARRAWPLGLFYLTQVLLGTTGLIVVGALGTDALAAVGLSRTLVFSWLAVGLAVLGAGLVLMAATPLATERREIVQASVGLGGVLLVGAVALQHGAPGALRLAGHDPAVIGLFADYTAVPVWAVLPAIAYVTLQNVLVAAGITAPIAISAASMVGANLVASVVLVHGAPGIEPRRIEGAAIATVIVELGGAAVLWIACRKRALLGTDRAGALKRSTRSRLETEPACSTSLAEAAAATSNRQVRCGRRPSRSPV